MDMMMAAAIQGRTLHTASASSAGKMDPLSNFGDVLTQTIASASEPANKDNRAALTAEQTEAIESLLEFLKLDDLSVMGDGEQLLDEEVFTAESLQSRQLLQIIFGKDSKEEFAASIFNTDESRAPEELLSPFPEIDHTGKEILTFGNEDVAEAISLFSSFEGEPDTKADLLQYLQNIIQQVLDESTGLLPMNKQLIMANAELKLSKIYTLATNNVELSANQLEKLEGLKRTLDQLLTKIESMLNVPSNAKKSLVHMISSQANNEMQVPFQKASSQMQTRPELMKQVGNAQNIAAAGGMETSSMYNPFLAMSKIEQLVLAMPADPTSANQEEFIEAFENLLSKAKFTNNNGVQRLFIKLNPENLGLLRIELIQKDGMMTAKIIASTKGAKELLDSQLQGLKQSFVNQNLPVEKVEISQTFTNMSQERGLQREQHQQQNSQDHSRQFAEEEEITDDFQNEFQAALLQAEK